MGDIHSIAVILSALAACLAWVAKLRWAKEYKAAKDETIKSKEEQINVLEREIQIFKDLTPMELQKYVVSIKKLFKEYNYLLSSQLAEAQKVIEEKRSKIMELEKLGSSAITEKIRLEKQIVELEVKVKELTDATKQYQERAGQEKRIEVKIPDIDISVLDRINVASESLGSSLGTKLRASFKFADISKMLQDVAAESAKNVIGLNEALANSFFRSAWTISSEPKKKKE